MNHFNLEFNELSIPAWHRRGMTIHLLGEAAQQYTRKIIISVRRGRWPRLHISLVFSASLPRMKASVLRLYITLCACFICAGSVAAVVSRKLQGLRSLDSLHVCICSMGSHGKRPQKSFCNCLTLGIEWKQMDGPS